MLGRTPLTVVILLGCLWRATAGASTVVFFDSSQIATSVASGVTSDTIRSQGYLFTYTRDKLFTGGIGPDPIGRQVRVPWPAGVEAQAVTTPPPGVTDYKARITLQRVDGDVFDLTSFTAKLLANTAGAGGSIEIMPLLDGEDAFNDPLYFDASGYSGSFFSYDESPNPWGSTALLKGFDTYKVGLYVDFAFTALTLEGAPVPGPPGDYNQNDVVDAADFTVWRDNLGSSVVLPNDPIGGTIRQSQYDTWKSNFGTASGSGSLTNAPVPEPFSISLVILSSIAIGFRRYPLARSRLRPRSRSIERGADCRPSQNPKYMRPTHRRRLVSVNWISDAVHHNDSSNTRPGASSWTYLPQLVSQTVDNLGVPRWFKTAKQTRCCSSPSCNELSSR